MIDGESDCEFRVMGPVEVYRGGKPVRLSSGTLLNLLTGLLMSPDRPVPAARLTECVWDARLPVHPRQALHSAILRLRRALGGDLVETLPSGYRLRTDPEHCDLLRFDQLSASARDASSAAVAAATLERAIGLWRGLPLANVDSPVLRDIAPELTGRYLAACEEWASLRLRLGQHEAVAARLPAAVAADPFRERIVGQLMIALYRSGRRAEALAAFDALRRDLARELGIDPGTELQGLHVRILRADPALRGPQPARDNASAVPRQLPRGLPDFCGREQEAAEIVALLTAATRAAGEEPSDVRDGTSRAVPGEGPVVVLAGQGGIGKTALAVQVAHQVAGSFPDGQLFADLRGAGAHPVRPESALGGFLRALGIKGPAIPRRVTERSAMYRSLLAAKRMLIVLDNAESDGQIAGLLPAGSGCAVIVTSRRPLGGTLGAQQVRLGVLGDHHALDLLGRIMGSGRLAAQDADARALLALCGGLPLALRIAGARLAARPHWRVADLVDRLTDTRRRLSEFTHGDLDVRASLALGYNALDPVAARALRLLSLLDAPRFPAWAAAALLGTGTRDATEICERLVEAQFLEAGTQDGLRYKFHDLVRAFGRERASAEEPVAHQAAALARAFGGWLALAERAHRHVYGGDFTILHGQAPRWPAGDPAVHRAIETAPLAWLETERSAILAAIRQSAELGLDELSWDLAWTAVTLYEARAHYDDWRAAQEHALAATRKAGNNRGTAAMLACGASLLLNLQRCEQARPLGEAARRLFAELGDTHGTAIAQRTLGAIDLADGRLENALDLLTQAYQDARAAGDHFIEEQSFRQAAQAHLERGEHDAARACLDRAWPIQHAIGSPRGQAMLTYTTGELLLGQRRFAEAQRAFDRVLTHVRREDVIGEAHVLLALGKASSGRGHRVEAVRYLRQALHMARQSRNPMLQGQVLFTLGELAAASLDRIRAERYFRRSLLIFSHLPAPSWQARAADALSRGSSGPSALMLTSG